jgi:hypothetical protein
MPSIFDTPLPRPKDHERRQALEWPREMACQITSRGFSKVGDVICSSLTVGRLALCTGEATT